MSDPLPKFNRPPVVETVLSAQFARLAKFRTAHAGIFWKSNLDVHWPSLEEKPRIDDQFERFGNDRAWAFGGGLRFSTSPEPQRTQITSSDSTRMIQLQDSRFIYNWKKGEDGCYPSYATTRQEFDRHYEQFQEFVKSSSLGQLDENQWEVTYVNHLPIGELWTRLSDSRGVFPWLNFPPSFLEPESFGASWISVLPENQGRLYGSLTHGRVTLDGPDALILNLTARGPVSTHSGISLGRGCDIGHEAIVRSFAAMTSATAHKFWERTQ